MNVLIIGLGSIAKKHISALLKINSQITVFALRSNIDSEALDGVINVFSMENALKNNIDFIIISNPTAAHFESINYLKDLGIPLFIEKPLFDRIGIEENILVNTVAKSTPTYIACNLRFLPCLQQLKKIIQGKRVNEVNIYCGSYLPDWRPSIDFRKVYSANKEMGGGVHIDLIHEIDYMSWLFGMPLSSSAIKKNNSSLGITACDYANFCFEYRDFCANVILNYYRRDAKRNIEILLDDATVFCNLLTNEIFINGELQYADDSKIIDTYESQLRYFMQEVLPNGKSDFNSINEAYKILELCMVND